MSILDWTPQDAADEHRKPAREPFECPECESQDIDKIYHSGTATIPALHFWRCIACEHEWEQP